MFLYTCDNVGTLVSTLEQITIYYNLKNKKCSDTTIEDMAHIQYYFIAPYAIYTLNLITCLYLSYITI